MSLKGLIEKQTIIIDDHRRGANEVKSWDDRTADVHIDKITHFPVEGKKQNVRIKVPINSERPIRIEKGNKNVLDDIPGQLKREIQNAFKHKISRELFIADLIKHISNFPTILNSKDRAHKVVSNLSKHFGLKWSAEEIAQYTADALTTYTEKYVDEDGKKYFITIEKDKIKIGEDDRV